MSRLAQPSRPQPSTKPTAASSSNNNTTSSLPAADSEQCPICKSTRYLNPSLRFLVNPECYHKLCASCVDRIFSHGPATCPLPNCSRTLRKHRFREQTFEDIRVEREVDIRKRVASVFNRREDEFEDLRNWNDYLNDVEDITFNLINSIDLDATNARFEAYRRANEDGIAENERLAAEEKNQFSSRQKAERQLARERREQARREEEMERRELEANRRDVLDRLAQGGDADEVLRKGEEVQLKKRMGRGEAERRRVGLQQQSQSTSDAAGAEKSSTSTGGGGPAVLKGLRKPASTKAVPEPPIDPFGGVRFSTKYFALQDEYRWEGVQDTRRDVKHVAGGYDVRDFTQRSLVAAFAGLGVFVGEEADERERGKMDGQEEEAVGTARADLGLKDSEMVDVA
ncbi:CDK-activating kinase assembly factor [Hortaea werneckii]|uniref:RNA polymerase II transcription factor B subunit 3 n=1 Tax=Hortaea werneckii TaxID=91943 RepID=A0A3M7FRZ5_HORWE|nr:CDK-activating kinase assembly factor [Hortaea werneckii]KAI6886892.1 CDK-activating kinase assembly factor [Hortaea werneckii]KAI6997005.1 CDK-activating kinase assembly factor [Hortaea werneckii]KAI7148052.1 CDK-activating kinase assembly factor [Hortaea werneckii]KAI7177976.1 CDK-activating kinase assembly factor [Hortaea werneckii]